jgi:hypothetical protein
MQGYVALQHRLKQRADMPHPAPPEPKPNGNERHCRAYHDILLSVAFGEFFSGWVMEDQG